jgi:hypothetical protein
MMLNGGHAGLLAGPLFVAGPPSVQYVAHSWVRGGIRRVWPVSDGYQKADKHNGRCDGDWPQWAELDSARHSNIRRGGEDTEAS